MLYFASVFEKILIDKVAISLLKFDVPAIPAIFLGYSAGVERVLKIALFKFSIEGANMALTNQQVQQVFLAIAGRPAEGSAVTWGANSLSVAALANAVVDIRKGTDFANSKETFVENLYQNLLGRASDAEGKEFWLKALNDGASYGDVLAQFINAVLAQSQTADLYTLQNKVSIAEQISAKIANFQGGKDAEAQLKDIMNNVQENTTLDNIQDDLNTFQGQHSNVTNVTVKQGAEEATTGSEEHATNYTATLDYSKDGEIQIEGSTNYGDTLNLKVKGTADTDKFTLSGVSNVSTINLDLSDAKIKTSDISTGSVSGLKNLTIKGASEDTVTVNTKGVTVDTGAGKDTINVEVASTIKAGAGNDTINVSAATDVTVSVDGGAGTDTVILGNLTTDNFKKLSLTSVEILSGKGELSYATLNGKSFKLADNNTDIAVSAKDKSGINLSSFKMDGDVSGGKIAIDDVSKGTVKLSAKDAGITETITLDAGAKKVTFNNVGTGDTVSVKNIAAIKAAAGNASTFSGISSGNITSNKAYFIEINDTNISQLTATQVEKAVKTAGLKATSSGKIAALAVEAKDGIVFYTLNSTTSEITANLIKDVQLIGLTGEEVTNSTLTLA